MRDRKGLANFLVGIIIAVLVFGTAGYFALVRKSSTLPPLIEEKEKQIESKTGTKGDKFNTEATPEAWDIIQELKLEDGTSIVLVSNKKYLSHLAKRSYNCTVPAYDLTHVNVIYNSKVTSLGFIGVPQKNNGEWPKVENLTDQGLNAMKTLEWAPLHRLSGGGFILIDYDGVRVRDPQSVSVVTGEKEGNLSERNACVINYDRMYYLDFEMNGQDKILKVKDVRSGPDLYNDLERFKGTGQPSLLPRRCSPFGCG